MKVLQKHKPAHFAGVHGRMTVKDHRHHCCYGDGRHSETNHRVLGYGSICRNQLDQREKHSFSQSHQERRWGILHLRQNLSHECSLRKKQETGVQRAGPFPLPLKPVLLEALLPREKLRLRVIDLWLGTDGCCGFLLNGGCACIIRLGSLNQVGWST